MEEQGEQVERIGQEEPRSSPEDRYYQRMKDTAKTRQHSRREIWELYQQLHAHHSFVQTCYKALETAVRTGQETKTLLNEYHEAISKHHLLVNRLRFLLQQQRMEEIPHSEDQGEQS